MGSCYNILFFSIEQIFIGCPVHTTSIQNQSVEDKSISQLITLISVLIWANCNWLICRFYWAN
jgi:hypothetical protein